jgi:hypothetical protein
MLWAKHYVGMVTDDKFAAAADIAAVNPLLPPVLFSALFERAIENGDGTIAGFQPRVFAAKFKVGLDEVGRTLAAFAELAIVVGDCIVNWTKRQGQAAIVGVASNVNKVARKLSTPRTRKHRARERQLSLLLPIAGTPASVPEGVPAFPERVPGVPEPKNDTISVDYRDAEKEKEKEKDQDSSLVTGAKNQQGVSGRCALSARPPPGEIRAKRANLIKTLARWVRYSGQLEVDEQAHRLAMLARAETALDCWDERPGEDKRAFDFLDTRARRCPLTRDMVLACEQAERDAAKGKMIAGWGKAA